MAADSPNDKSQQDWRAAALRLGEQLADTGPDNYYGMTPTQWLEWCENRLPSANTPRLTQEFVDRVTSSEDDGPSVIGVCRSKAPRDPNVKYPRLFYWEDAENCWCPAEGLEVENIIGVDLFMGDGEIEEVRFKRMDMTDAEFDAIPEG